MIELSGTFSHMARLLINFDPALMEIIGLSLFVALSACGLAGLIGLPLGAACATSHFPGRGVVIVVINAFMGLPPVVAGLVVYLLLSRAGPLGIFGLLYTPGAMIIAQSLLIMPIISALSRQSISDLWEEYESLLKVLGARRWQMMPVLLWDGRFRLMTAVLAGFGRAIAEVGAVMIVGGNIEHATRVMTTAIALETSKGNLALALALGVVLIAIAFTVNALVYSVNATARRMNP